MGFDSVCHVLHQLHDSGVRLLILEGGEPLLWRDGERDTRDVVTYAKELFWSVGLISNGTVPLPMEPDVLWVSIDGLANTTERIRGPIFTRQMQNIADSKHPRLFANITISTVNAAEILDLVRFLADKVAGITIQFYYPYESDTTLFVPYAQRSEILAELIKMKREGYPLLDSYFAMEELRSPGWRCHPWLIASANPDGTITQGCYLKGRTEISCELCGFAAHTEMSLAYDLNLGALLAGLKIFGLAPLAY